MYFFVTYDDLTNRYLSLNAVDYNEASSYEEWSRAHQQIFSGLNTEISKLRDDRICSRLQHRLCSRLFSWKICKTWNSQKLNIPLFKSAIGQRTFYYRTVILWNSLESNFKLCSNVSNFMRSSIQSFLEISAYFKFSIIVNRYISIYKYIFTFLRLLKKVAFILFSKRWIGQWYIYVQCMMITITCVSLFKLQRRNFIN